MGFNLGFKGLKFHILLVVLSIDIFMYYFVHHTVNNQPSLSVSAYIQAINRTLHYLKLTKIQETKSLTHINLLKPTGYVMHQQFNIQQLYALPTLYLCVLYLSEKKTATCATYSINRLVFITEMKSVYSAVRTGSLNKAVCASNLKG